MELNRPTHSLYLEPDDDGLLIGKGHEWTKEKHHYVKRYIDMFTRSMGKKSWRNRRYIDLFAECGKLRSEETDDIFLGSPLLALTVTSPFTDCVFVEMDEKKHEALIERCNHVAPPPKIKIFCDDSNQVVDAIVSDINRRDNLYIDGEWPSINLAFLDPYGLELHWDTVKKLASVKKMDLIIYYSQMGITRNLADFLASDEQTAADRFFGGVGWKEIAWPAHRDGKTDAQLHRLLMDYYKANLEELGYVDLKESPEPIMRQSKGAPLYRLIFASKHKLGAKLWKEANKVSLYGQKSLF